MSEMKLNKDFGLDFVLEVGDFLTLRKELKVGLKC
jgi:hypothetical protein